MFGFPRSVKKLITAFERLPGIGPKGASRLVFYLLATPKSFVTELADLLVGLKEVKTCQRCFGIAERELCAICTDGRRRLELICVVEGSIDVMALEAMGGYEGVYHVLGGVINPLDHVGPDDLKIAELMERVREIKGKVEVILATNPTMEGEATAMYIKKKLEGLGKEIIRVSRIGSGLPMGACLEYADRATLSRALAGRKEM